jgi:hypothetical protein
MRSAELCRAAPVAQPDRAIDFESLAIVPLRHPPLTNQALEWRSGLVCSAVVSQNDHCKALNHCKPLQIVRRVFA